MRRGRLAGLALVAAAMALFASAQAASAQAFAQGVPVKPGTAKAAQFEPPGACGCHASLVEQWSSSMHSRALLDPIFVAKVAEADKATNGALGPFCKKCHGPAATMSGEIGAKQMSPGVADGIQCSFCHQVVGDSGASANTSLLVLPDGTRRAQLKDPQAPHKAAYSHFHETAEFCGGCHNVNHPINGMHLEASYAEWRKSIYATEGVTCQDCHMSRQPGIIGPSAGVAAPGVAERPNIYAMTFAGGQVELGNAEVATAMLKSAAEVTLEAPEVVTGGSATATVTVTNKGAGHYLPTGLTEVREMWLEVYTEDANGKKTVVGERHFGTILQDAKGNAPVELWEAVKVKSDDRIPPRESVTEAYRISMPAGIEEATLKAALYYRSTSDALAQKAGTKNPTTEMASASQRIFASEDAQRAAAKRSVSQGTFFDGMNLIFAVIGLVVVFGLVIFFWMRSRRVGR